VAFRGRSVSARPTEAEFLERVRAGDPEALAEVFREHAQAVSDAAFRITRSRDEAEDVVQDVFVALPEALRSYSATGTLGAWIRRLATRTALLRLRHEKRRSRWQRQSAKEGPRQAMPDAVEARITLDRVLDRMPEEQRVVYVLKEMEGHSHADIARLLGITRAASEVRLHRARRFLRERLKGRL
jgi:RNA polymerase sigma-70 factor (ECF subfamily)